ncbi:MAG TPA: histidine kinase dimerization/phosphoacceptor domain -containing protein [Sphingomonas sp.]|nr:histidine kinase dimerization/phosphoacceptor domain -containing protein [Sphingomonas sp.]
MDPTIDRRRQGLRAAAARMPTGAKLFLILSAALLPLAVIALVATLQTNHDVDHEARARLGVAVRESARALSIELIGDMTALRVTLNALDTDLGNAPSCARAQGVFAGQVSGGARFMIADRQGRVVCGDRLPAPLHITAPDSPNAIAAKLVTGQGLALAMRGASGGTTATAYFPTELLARIARPTGFLPPHGSTLQLGAQQLTLDTIEASGPLDRRQRAQATLGFAGLGLEMSVRSAPISSPLLLAMMLPLLMWAAAASIAWFVVDRLLVAPLRRLRANVAAYVPGEEIDTGSLRALPALEIRELGDTFRTISRTVAAHETGLAEGLVRQTRLTREVHHRVKNNLQVISSLINLHARAARSADVTKAYASIQRRVDALAVVHRYHFAEMEENRGLSLRSVIGELASNIRATAPESSADFSILLDLEPFLVTQDTAVAVAFLVTELIELAMTRDPHAPAHISLRAGEAEKRAILRISSPALVDSHPLRRDIDERYGRVLEGLARQLRSALHYEPMTGGYEIAIAVTARD